MTWRLGWATQGIEVISEAVVKLGSTPYIVPEDEESWFFGTWCFSDPYDCNGESFRRRDLSQLRAV
jgi:hypothetical protein